MTETRTEKDREDIRCVDCQVPHHDGECPQDRDYPGSSWRGWATEANPNG